ncbi:MAG TPA: cytochrome c [Gemmatimonadaceae bacterium]|nr:cytochrome c [Gemmatimonadaceae bacterium]
MRRLPAVTWISALAALAALATIGCASAPATNVRTPLGAFLTPAARTGAPVPLRVDPNAHVVFSTAANLPPAPYTAAQAERGEHVFAGVCASCHQRDQFIGQAFVDAWKDRRVSDLYSLVSGTMPVNNPGGLKEDEYLGVVAYLLRANHATEGAPADSLRPDSTLRAYRIAVHAP